MSSLLQRYVASCVRTQKWKRPKTAEYSRFSESSSSASYSSRSSRCDMRSVSVDQLGDPRPCRAQARERPDRGLPAAPERTYVRGGEGAERVDPARPPPRPHTAAGRGRSFAVPTARPRAHGRGRARSVAARRAAPSPRARCRPPSRRSGTAVDRRHRPAPFLAAPRQRRPRRLSRARAARERGRSSPPGRRGSRRGRRTRGSSSGSLEDHCRVLDRRIEHDVGLPHPYPNPLHAFVACEERVGDRAREALEEKPLGTCEHLAHHAREASIVHRLLDPIARARGLVDVHPEIDEEPLAETPLLLEVAVMPEDHEAEQLDGHTAALPRSTAAAIVSASTVSRTSCVLSIHAPRS